MTRALKVKISTRALRARTLRIAGVTLEPSECLFLDDSVSNMRAAKSVGWRTVLVGRHARDTGDCIECEHADHAVDKVHELRTVAPELFQAAAAPVEDAAPAGAGQ